MKIAALWIAGILLFFYARETLSPFLGVTSIVILALALGLTANKYSDNNREVAAPIVSKPEILGADELKLKFQALPEKDKVRGVYEDVSWKNDRLTDDCLFAREVAIVDGKLCLRGSGDNLPKTWQEAAEMEVPGNAELKLAVPLEEIETIELQNHSEYEGEFQATRQIYVCMKSSSKVSKFKLRHPHIKSGGGNAPLDFATWYNPARDMFVFAYTKEGDRHLLFKTFSREHAVKWRKQIANRLDAWRADQGKPPLGVETKAPQSDYL